MRILLTVNGTDLPATLNDSATARDFASLLPLTLSLSDFHRNEKIADLPKRLSIKGAPSGTAANAGDLTYYSPWGNLAIFYRDFGHSQGLVSLGHIDAPLDPLISIADGTTLTVVAAQ